MVEVGGTGLLTVWAEEEHLGMMARKSMRCSQPGSSGAAAGQGKESGLLLLERSTAVGL